jgi:hypothetical protein
VGLVGGSATHDESVMAMPQSGTVDERILYWLSLDTQVRALAERLLEWCAVTVGDLPASAAHWTGTSPGM